MQDFVLGLACIYVCPFRFLFVRIVMQEDMADVSHESMMEYYHIANKMFNSEDEGYRFYNKYGLEKGFN